MSLGIQTSRVRRLAHRRTIIDGMPVLNVKGTVHYVDGTAGTNNGDGNTVDNAWATLTYALTRVDEFDTIFVVPKLMAVTDTDPGSYTEGCTISTPQISIIGLSDSRTQGGLPQIKVGTTTTDPVITVAAPGVRIANLGINGAGGTGGGIKLSAVAATHDSFGAVIEDCHFKNCVGTTATNSATGGAVQYSGAPWQTLIRRNRFYKNVGDIVLLNTAQSTPQDMVIEDNIFGGLAANVDCNINLAAGTGVSGVVIHRNAFPAMPALSSGSVLRFMELTNCVGGMVSENYFGGAAALTFGATGTGALVPTTVFLVNNYDEGGLIARA